MKNFIYSTELTADGPWLIDREALIELGKLVDDSWIRLNQRYVNRKIESERQKGSLNGLSDEGLKSEEQRKSANRWFSSQSKEIELKLGKEKSYVSDSLAHALTEQALINEEVTGLKISFGSAEINVKLSVDREHERLHIQTSPEREEVSKEIFVQLREWVTKYKAPLWQRLWGHFHGILWFIWILCIIFSIIFIPNIGDRTTKDAKLEAHKILEDGISQNEINKAIELILTIETKYSPKVKDKKYPRWFKLLFWLGGIVIVVLLFRPKLVVGIGKGSVKIKMWRKWLRFISITVPGLIFVSFLWPYFSQWLIKLFE